MAALALEDDQVAELALVAQMRSAQRSRRSIGDELHNVGDRVRVAATIHLLAPDHERAIRARLAELEDQVALRRHCLAADDPSFANMLRDALDGRAAIAAVLDDSVCRIDVTISRPSATGSDWRIDDLPPAVIESALARIADVRAQALRAVGNIVDSGLLQLVVGRTRAVDGIAEFAVVEHDADSVARVRAFAAEITLLGRAMQELTEHLRFEALHHARSRSRVWLADNDRRRRNACAALDMVRATHAAIAELQRACEP